MPSQGLEWYAGHILEQLLQNTPAQVGQAERARIGGMPAVVVPAVVQSQQGSVQLTVAAYEGPGGAAYHFIMVSQPGGSPALSELFSSFRLISQEEAATLRPRQIRVVRAWPGDTIQSVAARMPAENPLELFLMLNARSADQPLRPGEPVKIVAFAGS
jgi:predicted Zn-dependent protease